MVGVELVACCHFAVKMYWHEANLAHLPILFRKMVDLRLE